MSKRDKLIERLLERLSDFTYDEAGTLLCRLGYRGENRGRTSGSRVAFVNMKTNHIIRLHKPHPTNILKMYQIDELIEVLRNQGVIKL
jgi:hypothetical protein